MSLLQRLTNERDLKMVWRVTRDRLVSHLVGTAHFFPYSFRRSLTRYIRQADHVLLEGPLDQGNMMAVVASGSGAADSSALYSALDPKTIARINRELLRAGDRGANFSLYADILRPRGHDLLHSLTAGLRPWMAFFTIWVHCLEQRGWIYKMDLDAMRIAQGLGKEVHFLETIEEQIDALDGIPLERIVGFLKEVGRWGDYSKAFVKLYLRGDLEAMMNLSHPFPSRCESVIDRRDRILYDRMRPFLETGNALALVGGPHTRAIRRMLTEDGFAVRPPGNAE